MKNNELSHWHGWKMAPFEDPDIKLESQHTFCVISSAQNKFILKKARGSDSTLECITLHYYSLFSVTVMKLLG